MSASGGSNVVAIGERRGTPVALGASRYATRSPPSAVLWVEVAILLAVANLLPRLALAWSIPLGILLVLLMGLRMNAFGVILHEGSHGLPGQISLAERPDL